MSFYNVPITKVVFVKLNETVRDRTQFFSYAHNFMTGQKEFPKRERQAWKSHWTSWLERPGQKVHLLLYSKYTYVYMYVHLYEKLTLER